MLALCLLVPVPTVGAAAGLILVPGPLGQAIYAACKVWLVAFPLVWLLWVERARPGVSPPTRRGLASGLAQGAAILACIFAAHALFGGSLVDRAPMRAAVSAAGIDGPAVYLAFSAYLCLLNSLLEEYVWRWFVFEQLDTLLGSRLAVPASAAAFTVHHVVALGAQFDVTVTTIGSAGVFVGGLLWSWLYHRYRSIWPGYVSHVLADAGVLGVGWLLLFG